MALQSRIHPVLQYLDVLLCGLCAIATIAVSWTINPHSVSWLVGLYTCVVLFIAALRSAKKSQLHRSYALYLSMLVLYFLIVWFLHVNPPGPNVAYTHKYVFRMGR